MKTATIVIGDGKRINFTFILDKIALLQREHESMTCPNGKLTVFTVDGQYLEFLGEGNDSIYQELKSCRSSLALC